MEWAEKLFTPEVTGALLGIVVLLLAKSKFFTEQDFRRAREMMELGFDAGKVAQETRLTLDEIQAEHVPARQEGDAAEGGSNRKKVQRAARKALRGWLRF